MLLFFCTKYSLMLWQNGYIKQDVELTNVNTCSFE